MVWSKVRSAIILLAATFAALVALSACASEQEDPLVFGARATARAATPTPTPLPDEPTPTPVPAAEMERVAQERSDTYLDALYEPTEGLVRIGIWDDKRIQLDNHLVGYVIVYGYDYGVEMVETTVEEYPGLLETGELDIVLQTSPELGDWLGERSEDGAVIDVGTMVEATDGARIVVHGRLKERAPEIVDFLGAITADDEVFDSAVGTDHGGQAGDKSERGLADRPEEHMKTCGLSGFRRRWPRRSRPQSSQERTTFRTASASQREAGARRRTAVGGRVMGELAVASPSIYHTPNTARVLTLYIQIDRYSGRRCGALSFGVR